MDDKNMSEHNKFSGESWQERMARFEGEQEKAMENAEIKREIYSREDIEKLQDLQRTLTELSVTIKDSLKGVDPRSDEYKQQALSGVKDILSFLDGQEIWETKFTTSSGGADDDLDQSLHDSIYYMSKSGLSLRIKKAAITQGDGFEKVIQPIMELILFRDPGSKMGVQRYMRKPMNGWSVRDYATPAFNNLMLESSAEADYESSLLVHEKDGTVVGVSGPKDIWIHDGNKVNNPNIPILPKPEF